MTRFTLSTGGLSLPAARDLATLIEEDWRIATTAVALNETREGIWSVVSYLTDAESASTARTLYPGQVTALPDADWVRRSLAGLAPVRAGRFFLHGSHDPSRSGGISLEIDAGTAFGTGHHGTTEGCLLAFDAILKYRKPRRILDLGCGTGVLAIAAAKATGLSVLASDIDPEAVRVTRLNASRNRAQVRAVIAPGLKSKRIAEAAPFDLIFANILARPLVELAHDLARNLLPGGVLILSGLTLDQSQWVFAAYRNRGFRLKRLVARGGWVTLVLASG